MNKDRPDCYECKWRGPVSGSAHSSCTHPKAKSDDEKNPIMEMVAIFASVGRVGPMMATQGARDLNVKGDAHGIANGWFNWPWNFDPVWLESCDGWEFNDKPVREGFKKAIKS